MTAKRSLEDVQRRAKIKRTSKGVQAAKYASTPNTASYGPASTTVTFPYTEDFEGVTPPALPDGFATSGAGGEEPSDLFQTATADGVTNAPGSFWAFPEYPGQFALSNDDLCNCDKSEDYLILPPIDMTGSSTPSLSFNYILRGIDFGAATVEVSTDSVTFVELDSLPNTGNSISFGYVVDLGDYTMATNLIIRFKYDDGGEWGYGLAVDNIAVTDAAAIDATLVDVLGSEYAEIPFSLVQPLELTALVESSGSQSLTNTTVTVTVTDALENEIFTFTSDTIPTIETDSIVDLGEFTPEALDTYTLTYTVNTEGEGEIELGNNTLTNTFSVTDSAYARHTGLGTSTTGFGVASTENTARLGTVFGLPIADTLTSVSFQIVDLETGVVAGDTTYVEVYGADAEGIPDVTNLIATSDTLVFEEEGGVYTLGFPDTLALSAGNYFIALVETVGTASLGLGALPNIFTPETCFFTVNDGAVTPIDGVGLSTFTITANFANPAPEPGPPARVQVIHNAPAIGADVVDVYANDILVADDLAFRSATAFIDAPSGTPIVFSVTDENSTGPDNAIVSVGRVVLEEEEAYIAVANSGVPPSSAEINLYVGAREEADDQSMVDVLVHHGSFDAPEVQVFEVGVNDPAVAITDPIEFADFEGYISLMPDEYDLQIRTTGGDTVGTYITNLSDLAGSSLTVIASGLVNAADPLPSFGLFVVFSTGGAFFELPDLSTSYNAPESHLEVAVYPNPATAQLRIDANGVSLSSVELFDLLGRRVLTADVSATSVLDLSSLPVGSYFLRLTSEEGTSVRKVSKR